MKYIIFFLFLLIPIFIWLWSWFQRKRRYKYYRSFDFLSIKNRVKKELIEIYNMYNHFENLKLECLGIINNIKLKSKIDYSVIDEVISCKDNQLIYNCSLSICKNAENQPFKYICKYFKVREIDIFVKNLNILYKNLVLVRHIFNNIKEERERIIDNVLLEVPRNIKKYRNELKKQLSMDFNLDYSNCILTYIFKYVSPQGHSSKVVEIPLNNNIIPSFLIYLKENER